MLNNLLPRILIVEQPRNIKISLYNDIERAGFDILKADNLEKIFTFALKQIPDVLIVNVTLPENLTILTNKIRKVESLSKIPLIFLLEKDYEITLSSEMNNFISVLYKPFSSDQLINLIKNLLRRSKTILQDNTLRFKNLTIDLNTQKLYKNGQIIRLGPTEFKILQLFLQSPTTIFSRQVIIEYLWNGAKEFNPRVIDVHINRIREALSTDKKSHEFIKTVRFIGYCLNHTENN